MLRIAAIGRLEDESQLVIRAALQLLFRIILNSPFESHLYTPMFVAGVLQCEEEVRALQPPDEDELGPQWEEGTVKVGPG